jgi:hypothetical protein
MNIRGAAGVLICLGLIQAPPLTAAEYSPLRYGIRVGEYFDLVYAPRIPGGPMFVFFRGEPIALQVEIFNPAPTEGLLVTNAATPSAALRFVVAREDVPVSIPRNAVPIDVPFVVPKLVNRSGRYATEEMEWTTRMVLEPGGKLSLSAEVGRTDLPVGVYTVDVTVDVTDGDMRALAPQVSRYQFELRESTADVRLEVARREATRAWFAGDLQKALDVTSAMLAGYPNSFAAYFIRGGIATTERQPDEAARNYERALEILEQGRDTIYLQSAVGIGIDVNEAVDSIRQLAIGASRAAAR